VKLVKELLGEEVEAVLQRLDRLTLNEARTTAAQTLEVVYGLVQNMRVVMDGKQTCLDSYWLFNFFPLDGRTSIESVRDALGRFCL
jgi:hypothetical protein